MDSMMYGRSIGVNVTVDGCDICQRDSLLTQTLKKIQFFDLK